MKFSIFSVHPPTKEKNRERFKKIYSAKKVGSANEDAVMCFMPKAKPASRNRDLGALPFFDDVTRRRMVPPPPSGKKAKRKAAEKKPKRQPR